MLARRTFSRRGVVAVVVAVAFLVIAYFMFSGAHHGRSVANGDQALALQPAHPNPIEQTSKTPPTKQYSTPTLQAAHTAFVKARQCSVDNFLIKYHRRRANCAPLADKLALQPEYAQCMNNITTELQNISTLERRMTDCSAAALTPSGYFAVTKAAAMRGDPDAQVCFVLGGFLEDGRAGLSLLSQAEIDEYRALAPKYIDEAFARGDWRIVAILSKDRISPADALLHSIYSIGTPETVYKMTKLLELGASKELADTLAIPLDNVARAAGNPNAELSLAAVSAANQWARDTYLTRFASSPRLDEIPIGCPLPAETGA